MRPSTSTLLAALATSVLAYSATQGTFAVNYFYGNGPLVMGRMDPIISPGVPSGHVHAVQGENAFALTSTDNQLLSSTCTSALVKNDKSAYWTPSLYFHDPSTGLLENVEMYYMNVFDATTDVIEPFPPGLRIVVGNPNLRTPPVTGGLLINDRANGVPQPVQWVCPRTSANSNNPLYPADSDGLHDVGIQDSTNAGAGVGFPDQNCDGYASPLRAKIHFPSCLNKSASIDDFEYNMEWPTNGKCPSGFTHVPHLFYEVYWNTPVFSNRWTQGEGTQPFVLSNGDPTGYSLHADFLAGWDIATLTQIINNCNTQEGGMDTCPGLIGGLNDPSTSCNIPDPVNEVVTGTMSALPGNNPVGTWGGGKKPTPTSSTATTSAYYSCYADTNARVPTSMLFANIGQNAATNTLYTIVGMEYGGQYFYGNQLVGSSKVDKSKCSMPYNRNADQIYKGSSALSV
ncbi:protein of unknown function (DUF1996) domain containing protein [Hyaloscypha variabilis]